VTVKLVGAPRYYGTNSERVAFTEEIHRGSLWIETDTEDIYCYTGTTWILFGGTTTPVPDHDHTGDAGDGGRISLLSQDANIFAEIDADGDFNIQLGDAAGARRVSIKDSVPAEVAGIDSDGKADFVEVDLNGNSDALILDADGDTTFSAPTDDEIDIEVGGSDIAEWKAGGLYFAPAKDTWPNDERRGWASRFINPPGLTAWECHFRTGFGGGGGDTPGNGELASYAWQGAPLGGAPAAVAYTSGNTYLVATDTVGGTKHLLSKAITNAAASWQNKFLVVRVRTGITTEIGLRFDAGDDDNWAEIYVTGVLANGTQRVDFRYRDNGGAITTVNSAVIVPMSEYLLLRLQCSYAAPNYSATALILGEDNNPINISGLSHLLTGNWAAGPPTAGRAGIMVANAGNVGSVDWFENTFT
jgi:hypothetical protein